MTQGRLSWPLVMSLASGLAALVYLPWLGLTTLVHEEPRRALIAKTMKETGNYLVPYLGGEIYLAKPPLYNWLIALFAVPGGQITEFNARLVSVVALLLIAGWLPFALRRVLGRNGALFLAASVLLAPELMLKAQLAEIELVFTLFVTLSLWCWLLSYRAQRTGARLWIPALFFLALAFLAKGPPGFLFFYLAVAVFLAVERRPRTFFSSGHVTGFAVFAAIVALWAVPLISAVGWDSVMDTFRREALERGVTTSTTEILQHAVMYPFEILLASFPFSLLVVPLVFKRTRIALNARYGKAYRFAIIALLANLPVYMTRDANVRYFLPMFPTLLVLSAMVFDRYVTDLLPSGNRFIDYAVRLVGALAIALALALAAITLVPEWRRPGIELLPVEATAGLAAASALILAFWLIRYWRTPARHALLVLVGFMLVVRLAWFGAILPERHEKLVETRNPQSTLESLALAAGTTVAADSSVPYDLFFYAPPGVLVPIASASESSPLVLSHRSNQGADTIPTEAGERWRQPYKRGTLLLHTSTSKGLSP